MQGKSALLAGVAVIALVAATNAGYAKGSSDAMSSSPPPPAATTSGPSNEELSARIDALEEELQAAEVREAADHAKVDAWKPMSGWWDNTTISGRMYWDITNVSAKRNGTAQTVNGTSFDIKRFYLGVDHKFNDTFSANLTTDVTYDSTVGASQIYIKKAYLQAKLDDAFTVRVGSADLPWVPYVEDIYGYRYVENTLIDRAKFGTSADWGVHVLGKFADGIVAYQFSAVTGAGYKKAATYRTLQPDIEGRISINYEGFQAAVGGYTGKLGIQKGTIRKTADRFDALAAYTAHGLRLGVEYFTASDYAYGPGSSSTTNSTHGSGYGPFASYNFTDQWAVFSKYEYVKPYSDVKVPSLKPFHNDYYNIGISWEPTKIVDFALVYKHDAGSAGYLADSNGTIGGTAFAAGNNGAYSEIGIWGQFRW